MTALIVELIQLLLREPRGINDPISVTHSTVIGIDHCVTSRMRMVVILCANVVAHLTQAVNDVRACLTLHSIRDGSTLAPVIVHAYVIDGDVRVNQLLDLHIIVVVVHHRLVVELLRLQTVHLVHVDAASTSASSASHC